MDEIDKPNNINSWMKIDNVHLNYQTLTTHSKHEPTE